MYELVSNKTKLQADHLQLISLLGTMMVQKTLTTVNQRKGLKKHH